MNFYKRFGFSLLTILLSTPAVNAQQQTSAPINTPLISQTEREELVRLRQEKEIRDRVQIEVDRAFRHTTFLLNLLLFLLALLPIGAVIGIWLLRHSIINQLTSQIQSNLEKTQASLENHIKERVNIEFRTQSDDFYQQMESLKYDGISQAQNLILEAQNLLQELRLQEDMIEQLRSSQPQTIDLNLEIKEPVLDNYNTDIPSSDIKDVYSASDYIQQGDKLFNEGRYEDANKSYNEALKIERDSPEARYQNARCYALRYSVNLAIGNLQWAIDINPMYREIAKTDSAFEPIRNDEKFKQLLNI